jgi:hypothetical protein
LNYYIKYAQINLSNTDLGYSTFPVGGDLTGNVGTNQLISVNKIKGVTVSYPNNLSSGMVLTYDGTNWTAASGGGPKFLTSPITLATSATGCNVPLPVQLQSVNTLIVQFVINSVRTSGTHYPLLYNWKDSTNTSRVFTLANTGYNDNIGNGEDYGSGFQSMLPKSNDNLFVVSSNIAFPGTDTIQYIVIGYF